ncbi:guanylate kinase [Nitrospina watsonii]|uniref:Guanylate kinase n=1 Tax=Nitrospina watsonii TaxID=1323948 RepID=A0ABN8W244_9BACT|nr:guanylate kinase [Nitrospina watsonii]CAI2718114.1 guanylate kinase [Nitrospina watsonii]
MANSRSQSNSLLIVLSAPSGTGKTTVCRRLREMQPELKFSVSHTTRPPRQNERNGIDYHFINGEQFETMQKNDEFLESAWVHNHFYGTACETLRRHRERGEDVVLELDPQGAASIRKLNLDAVFIFILPPSLQELERRLRKRNTESDEKITERLIAGKMEIAQYHLYDYIVANHDVEETVQTLLCIIHAEKYRSTRFQTECPVIGDILKSG